MDGDGQLWNVNDQQRSIYFTAEDEPESRNSNFRQLLFLGLLNYGSVLQNYVSVLQLYLIYSATMDNGWVAVQQNTKKKVNWPLKVVEKRDHADLHYHRIVSCHCPIQCQLLSTRVHVQWFVGK